MSTMTDTMTCDVCGNPSPTTWDANSGLKVCPDCVTWAAFEFPGPSVPSKPAPPLGPLTLWWTTHKDAAKVLVAQGQAAQAQAERSLYQSSEILAQLAAVMASLTAGPQVCDICGGHRMDPVRPPWREAVISPGHTIAICPACMESGPMTWSCDACGDLGDASRGAPDGWEWSGLDDGFWYCDTCVALGILEGEIDTPLTTADLFPKGTRGVD